LRAFVILLFVFSFFTTVSAQLPLDKQLVYIDFDGNVFDNNQRLSIVDGDSIRFGLSRRAGVNQAVKLDGGGPAIVYQDSGLLALGQQSSLTIAYWLNVPSEGVYCQYAPKSNFQKGSWTIGTDKSGHCFFSLFDRSLKNGVIIFKTRDSIEFNKWQHVAITVSKAKSFTFYVNGKKDTSLTIENPPDAIKNALLSLSWNPSMDSSSASLDEIRVFKGELSRFEIEHIYFYGLNTTQLEFDLGNPNSAHNSATVLLRLTPDGNSVLIDNQGFMNTASFTYRLINRRKSVIAEFKADKKDYRFDYSLWKNDPVFFIEVVDNDGLLNQVYRVNLSY
jgi:hypothetical protein